MMTRVTMPATTRLQTIPEIMMTRAATIRVAMIPGVTTAVEATIAEATIGGSDDYTRFRYDLGHEHRS